MKPWLQHYDPQVSHSIDYRPYTVHGFLEESASMYPLHAATIFKDSTITYKELNDLSNRMAAWLVNWGLRKGDRVALLLPNMPQFVLAYYAILKAGGVVVALNPAYKLPELTFLLNDSGARLLIGLTSQSEILSELLAATQVEALVTTNVDDAFSMTFCLTLDQDPQSENGKLMQILGTAWEQKVLLPEVGPDDGAVLQYSGGTTGTPKGAIGLHRNLSANTQQFSAWLHGMTPGCEVVMAAIPLFHVYGMVIAMSLGVSLAASLVLVPNPREVEEVLRNIEKYGVTLFPGVPSMYHTINHQPDVLAGKYNLKSIKACISGSAPLLKETKEQFERLTGGHLMEGYGLSEAPTATHCNPMQGENRTGSIGLPLPDVDCRIISLEDNQSEMKPGEIGELQIRGPQIMAGYHNQPEETREALKDGWLHTGDIARMDEEGYFYIVDRKKEMIKVNGLQVWPREVEEVIAQHPAVKEVAAAGVPHEVRGETVKAWVVLRPEAALTLQELQVFCSTYLANYKIPTEMEIRSELPRTTVGKLLRRELQRKHREA